jgi:hypothetical protein
LENPIPFPCPKSILEGWCKERGKAFLGRKYGAGWSLKIRWPGELGATVQPPNSLQQDIDGAEIGKESIRIDVETLLQRLRSDDDNAANLPEFRRKGLFYGTVEQPAIFWSIAAMVQGWAVADSK